MTRSCYRLAAVWCLVAAVLCVFASCAPAPDDTPQELIVSPIVGKWNGDGFTMEFTSDGVCYYDGEVFGEYSITFDRLVIASQDHSQLVMTVSFEGDAVTFRLDGGGKLDLTRAE